MSEKPSIDSIFCSAIEIESSDQRDSFVERSCGEDPELKRQVERLLQAHFDGGSVLDSPAAVINPTLDIPAISEKPGATIGRYKLLQQIGEGGMGVVYMAEQNEPVQRKVALKIIKPGMDTNQVIARFEAERQALAMMDHNNIARVLDAGATDSGRPFFVMELVRGVPITKYCDENKLDTRQRLELFTEVCNAVQHAHQKGIIHRDLKPSNVLVTLYDGKPVPKVIDFGVAKATSQKLTERTMFTQFGQMIGTLEYMSPEQAEMSGLDIDTRSDIYSLGVLLYELLTGGTPLDRKRFKEAALDEIQRMIREEEPPKPSTRLSTTDELASISAQRGVEPKKLSMLIRGDLDWIVMKSLEKDRTRRYESASNFAADVHRYLTDEPVEACPPSASYKLRKFARRNKVALATGAMVAGVLLLASVVSTALAIKATNSEHLASERLVTVRQEQERTRLALETVEGERDRAVKAEQLAATRLTEVAQEKKRAQTAEKKALTAADAAEKATAKAEQRTQQLETGNEIISGIFKDLDIVQVREGDQPLEAVLAERLVKAAEQLEGEAVGDPLVVARLQDGLGISLQGLGYAPAATLLFEKSLATHAKLLGGEHPNTLSSMSKLASAYVDAGQLDLAIPLLEETLKLKKAKLGGEHPSTLTSMNNLATTYQDVGQLDKALPLLEETLKLTKANLGGEHFSTLSSMNNLALTYQAVGQLDKALSLLEETLKLIKERSGPEHLNTLTSMNNLALAYQAGGQLDKALPLLEKALKLRKAKLGGDHPITLTSMNNLAQAYKDVGQLDKALPLFEETLKLRKAKLGGDHPYTLGTMNNLAMAYLTAGQLDQALPLMEETLKLAKAKLGGEHPNTLTSMNNLAQAYKAVGQLDKALPLFEETLKLTKAKLGGEHPFTLTCMNNLAKGYLATGQLDKALPLLEETLKLRKAKLDGDHPYTLGTMNNLAMAYLAAGQLDQALPLLEETLKLRKEKLGGEHPDTLTGMNNLAKGYLATGQLDKALPLLEKALKLRKEKLGGEHPDTLASKSNLAQGYRATGQLDKALPLFEETLKLMKAKLGGGHPSTLNTMKNLAVVYQESSRLPESLALGKELLELARKSLPPDSPQLASQLASSSLLFLKAKVYTETEPILRECLAIREKTIPNHWLLFNTKSMLGGALLGQKKYAEAEPLLLAGYQGLIEREAEIPGADKIRLIEALQRLVTLYEETDKREEAATWQAELDKR